MTQNKTVYIFRREGQARTRRRYTGKRCRTNPRPAIGTIALYVFLIVAGIVLYRAGAAYAMRQRGYFAVGGEVFALFLPVIWYAAGKTLRDLIGSLKNDGEGRWHG